MSGDSFVDYYELLQLSANADDDTIHGVVTTSHLLEIILSASGKAT